jgi:transketolase
MNEITGKRIRSLILEESRRANVGHIASALSIADIIAVLFDDVLAQVGSGSPDRDRFVLSKGHASLAMYAAFYCKGLLTREQLSTYCADGSLLGTHPEHALPGVDFCTGSLGQGLSFGAGAALAARMQRSARRVFVLGSDAELNEGSTWEAAMFAAHHRLGQLTLIIDANGQQAMGMTEQVLNLEPLADRWRGFGWDAVEVDGHDATALRQAFAPRVDTTQPSVIIARTNAGSGVSYMERQVKWHYLPMSSDQYAQAQAEIEALP